MNVCQPLPRGALRDALVSYARSVTDNGSIDAMSLRAAARDLGVSSGAVYRHFCDKDALLKEVAFQGFLEMRDLFHAIRPEDGPAPSAAHAVARAYAMGRAFVAYAHQNPTLWRMMFGRIGVMCREEHKKDADLMRYTTLDCVAGNCEDLHRLGAIPEPPTMDDVRFLWSAIHGAADLAQSGVRLDTTDQDGVADQTTLRSLRALGCAPDVIEAGVALMETRA